MNVFLFVSMRTPCVFVNIYIKTFIYCIYHFSPSQPLSLEHRPDDVSQVCESSGFKTSLLDVSVSSHANVVLFCSVLDTASYPTKRVSCLPDIADLIRSCLFHNFSLILFVFVLNVLRLDQITFIVHLSGMFIVVCQAQSALRSFAWLLSASVINKLAHILRRVEQRAASEQLVEPQASSRMAVINSSGRVALARRRCAHSGLGLNWVSQPSVRWRLH